MMIMKNKVCMLILSHGRADNVITYKTLRKHGYTGDIKIIIDDEDKQKDRYLEIYKNEVIIFSKSSYIGKIDRMINEDVRNTVLFARNAINDLTENLDYNYFCELDDDYNYFGFRCAVGGKCKELKFPYLDELFSYYVEFMENAKAVDCIALAQGGDYIGGIDGSMFKKTVIRKVMNSFFFKKGNAPTFYGFMNDDTNLYIKSGNRGKIFFTPSGIMLHQAETQQNKGGLTDMYLKYGTYIKPFLTVMLQPSSAKVYPLGNTRETNRLHHKIDWKRTVPQIIREKHKKLEV